MRQLIEKRGNEAIAGVRVLVKKLIVGLIQEVMDAKIEEKPGYSKYDYKNKRLKTAETETIKDRQQQAG